MNSGSNDTGGTCERSPTSCMHHAMTLALSAASLLLLANTGRCIAHRLAYPHDLEWMEGCFVDHARWIAMGRSVFAPPSAEFVPMLYMPLSDWLAAQLIKLGIDGLLAGRLLSLIGVAGAALIGAAIASRATKKRLMWLVVPGLIAGAYLPCQTYFDIVRPDNLVVLFAAMMLAGLAARSDVLSAFLLAAGSAGAVATKQSALVFVVVVLAAALWRRRRAGMMGLAGAGAIGVAWLASLGSEARHWLYVITMELPRHHRADWRGILNFGRYELLGPFLPIALSLVCVFATRTIWRKRAACIQADARSGWSLLVGTIAAICYSVASHLNAGAARNVDVPLTVIGFSLVPVAILCAAAAVQSRYSMPIALSVLCAITLLGWRDLNACTPTKADEESWSRYRQALLHYGPADAIWTPYHAGMTGRGAAGPMWPHLTALRDYIGGYYGTTTGMQPPAALTKMIHGHAFAAIVLGQKAEAVKALIEHDYRPDPASPRLRLPMFCGWPTDEETIWIPQTGSTSQITSPPH